MGGGWGSPRGSLFSSSPPRFLMGAPNFSCSRSRGQRGAGAGGEEEVKLGASDRGESGGSMGGLGDLGGDLGGKPLGIL